MVLEQRRPPQYLWAVLAGALAAFVVSAVLRTQTSHTTWYELALLLVAVGLVTSAWVLLAPTVIHRLRPSSYEHKSTTGERLAMAGLWAVLAGALVTFKTGPGWAAAALLLIGCAGVALLMWRQKRRIRG